MAKKQYVPVECIVLRTTDSAILIGDENGEEHWIPRSLCDNGDEIAVDDEEVSMEFWKADELGLV